MERQRLLCVLHPEREDFPTIQSLMVSIENAVDAIEHNRPVAPHLAREALLATQALNEDEGEEREKPWCPPENGWVQVDKLGAFTLFYHDKNFMAVLVRNVSDEDATG